MEHACGSKSGQCGCAGSAEPAAARLGHGVHEVSFPSVGTVQLPVATINDIALHRPEDSLSADSLRQRAYGELLRQEAIAAGLLAATDPATDDGVQSDQAVTAIERLLELNVHVPAADETDCRRYFDAQPARFRGGERVHSRHILFAVTPGVDVVQLRKRAEAALLDARCHDDAAPDKFAGLAASLSNCPSGTQGGDLGWLAASDCAFEFARELFGRSEVGVLPRLVHSRFGLHVVEVLARQAGVAQSYESVRDAVALALQQQSYVTALRQYLQLLSSRARVSGVVLETTDSPLVQ